MLDTTFAVNGKTLQYGGTAYTIESAGIRNNEPYATVTPHDDRVVDVIVQHIRKFMPLPFSLVDIQNDLN